MGGQQQHHSTSYLHIFSKHGFELYMNFSTNKRGWVVRPTSVQTGENWQMGKTLARLFSSFGRFLFYYIFSSRHSSPYLSSSVVKHTGDYISHPRGFLNPPPFHLRYQTLCTAMYTPNCKLEFPNYSENRGIIFPVPGVS